MRNKKFKKAPVLLSSLISGILFFVVGLGTTYASPATCTWTGGGDGTSWNSSTNWSCTSGTIPATGDNLVFNLSILSGNVSLNNNISNNLAINNISFTGSGGHNYTLTGDSVALSGGVTDTSNTSNDISLTLNLAASQTFTDTPSDQFSIINMGAFNLALSGAGYSMNGQISGTGSLNVNATGESFFGANNTGLSGPVNINAGTTLVDLPSNDALGSGQLTVANGASLLIEISSANSYTLSNSLTLGGSGDGAAGQIEFAMASGGTSNVTFNGSLTLTANTQVTLTRVNLNVAGSVSGCNKTVSTTTGSVGTLSGTLVGSCSSSSSSSATTTTSSSTIKDPDTGYGAPAHDNNGLAFVGIAGVLMSLALGFKRLAKARK